MNLDFTKASGHLNKVTPGKLFDQTKSSNDDMYDLVFWYKQGTDIPSPSLIVTRNEYSKSKSAPKGFDVLHVDFRPCDKNCTELYGNFTRNESSIQGTWQYRFFSNMSITLHHETNSRDSGKITFEEITVWNSTLHKHVSIKHLISAWNFENCESGNCPESCPQNLEQGPSPYPYIRDTVDGICKSLHPNALPPVRKYGGKCGCTSTCFTPEVGEPDSFWPWSNESEYNQFRRRGDEEVDDDDIDDKKCKKERPRQNFEPRFICPEDMGKSLPCPLQGAFAHHLFFIPKAKLIFCGIPKVGITEWIKFFRYTIGAKDYLSVPHYKKDRTNFFLKSLDPLQAQALLNDPSWTKAVFLRNPLDRLLSAYFDKIVGQGYTQKAFKIGRLEDKSNRPTLTFQEFVDRVTNTTIPVDCSDPNGLKGCTDPHWRPQTMMCGLDYMLPWIDFIGNFDHIAEHTKLLLEKVGIWEDFGSTFDDGIGREGRTNKCWVSPLKRHANETIPGFNQRGPSKNGEKVHATDSKSKFEQYYTPELIEKVRQAYHLDFAVWDEISKETLSTNQVLSGRDIPIVQQQCSKSSVVP
eukprot:Nitzschia sp. Nitz4//scaffold5_size260463//244157//245893//NITZ4_001032-RA/size260463-processed-gene-0.152-mRNA-1//-1//CDS//3329555490//8994//frame0